MRAAQIIREQLQTTVHHLFGEQDSSLKSAVTLHRPKNPQHGDYATNIAMLLSAKLKIPPRKIAEKIIANLPSSPIVKRTDIAGAGFINFHLESTTFHAVLNEIAQHGSAYGNSDCGAGQSVLIEFVSANPTGPLHVGHGRGAVYGDALGNLLKATGFHITKEYYVNDSGRQIDILALSIWLRYLRIHGNNTPFPKNAYQGDYITQIAKKISAERNEFFLADVSSVNWPNPRQEAEEETILDSYIGVAKHSLQEKYLPLAKLGTQIILHEIQDDLESLGVTFDCWFSERSLLESNKVSGILTVLTEEKATYQQDGATWLRSSYYGDDKDHVLIRQNGRFTYFASDIAYHRDKYERQFDRLINLWGADHHGYVARLRAAIKACGAPTEKLTVLLIQFAALLRAGEKIQMSTRSGNFITLRELREEVGKDATRFFYLMKKNDQHLEFDLDLAKKESNSNPVYYVQYAHARISGVQQKLKKDGTAKINVTEKTAMLLVEEKERLLLKTLSHYPGLVKKAALQYEPHQICFYLRDLASAFHSYYNHVPILVEDLALRNARLTLIFGIQQVLKNGLRLLGVTAPDKM